MKLLESDIGFEAILDFVEKPKKIPSKFHRANISTANI